MFSNKELTIVKMDNNENKNSLLGEIYYVGYHTYRIFKTYSEVDTIISDNKVILKFINHSIT